MAFKEEGTLQLSILAKDLASGNIGKFLGDMDKMAKKGGLMGSVFQGVGQSFGQMLNPVALVGKGIGMVTDFLGDAVTAAAEEEASIAQLSRSLEENSASWDGNMNAIEEVISAREQLAFADDEQRDSLRQLVAVTKDHEEALRLQRTAMDLARLKDMSLADAGTLLGKVYGGNVSILRRYGIQLKAGTSATEALAAVQKMAAGQAETFADTAQGKGVVAQLALQNAMEDLGSVLTPLMADFASFAADVIPKIADAIGNLGDAFNNLNRFLDPNLALQQDYLEKLPEIAKEAGVTVEQILAYDAAQERAANSTGAQVTAIEALIAAERAYYAASGTDKFAANEAVIALLAAETGQTIELTRAVGMSGVKIREQITILLDLAAQNIYFVDTWEAATEAVETNTEAIEKARAAAMAVAEQMRQQDIMVKALTGSFIGLSLGTEDATDASAKQAGTLRAAALATAAYGARMQALDDAMEEAAETFQELRGEAKQTEKLFQKLIDGPNENRKSIKLLSDAVDKWSTRYTRALLKGRDDIAKFSLDQLRQAETELASRRDVRTEMEKQRKKVQELSTELGNVPKKTIARVLLEGGEHAVRQLSLIKTLLGALGGISTPAITGRFAVLDERKGARKDGAHGATYSPGDYGLVGERGMERIRNVGGVTRVEPIPGASRGGGVTVNISMAGGIVLGSPLGAQQFAAAAGPAIVRWMRQQS